MKVRQKLPASKSTGWWDGVVHSNCLGFFFFFKFPFFVPLNTLIITCLFPSECSLRKLIFKNEGNACFFLLLLSFPLFVFLFWWIFHFSLSVFFHFEDGTYKRCTNLIPDTQTPEYFYYPGQRIFALLLLLWFKCFVKINPQHSNHLVQEINGNGRRQAPLFGLEANK